MIDDAMSGNIDLIITKSITRFAINTVTLLETVRKLKENNIDVILKNKTFTLYQKMVNFFLQSLLHMLKKNLDQFLKI